MLRKCLKTSVMSAFLLLAAGCGHNMLTYGDGFMLETTLNPDTYTVGIGFKFGKILTICARENTQVELTSSTDCKTETTPDAGTVTKLTIRTGPQITGYYVSALEAGAKAEDLNTYQRKEQANEPAK